MQDDYLKFATETVAAAGAIALRHFRHEMAVENKKSATGFDPVTQADRDIETFIRRRIAAEYPDHEIFGEELGTTQGASDYCWVIDPIDGTRSFITGVPLWGILLGLKCSTDIVCGVMHQPFLDETFAADATGAKLTGNGQTRVLKTSATGKLSDAKLCCTHPDMFTDLAGAGERFQQVARQCRLLRYGGDCYSYCMLALGQIDLVIEADLQPYDIVPLIPIVEAAGGVITNWQGASAARGGLVVAAANAELHGKALQLLRSD